MIIAWSSVDIALFVFLILLFMSSGFVLLCWWKQRREIEKDLKKWNEREKEYYRKEKEKKKEGENGEGRHKVDVFGMGDNEETFVDNGWLGGDEYKEEDDGDDDKGETK